MLVKMPRTQRSPEAAGFSGFLRGALQVAGTAMPIRETAMRLAQIGMMALAVSAASSTRHAVLHADDSQPGVKSTKDQIDFAHDIVPILQKRCAKCHAGTQKKGGFSINARQALLAGGDDGPAVVPRHGAESALIKRVSSDDPDLRMPPEGERLTRDQVDLLRRWIDLEIGRAH